MRRFILLLVAALLLTSVYAQPNQQQISRIDKLKQKIKTHINSYLQTENINDSTGYRHVYRKGKDLTLIMVNYKDQRVAGKYIDKKVEWYFLNDRLIYSEQTWTDLTTGTLIDNQKFYLDQGHLVAWIKSGNVAAEPTSQPFKDTEAELLAYEIKMKEKAK